MIDKKAVSTCIVTILMLMNFSPISAQTESEQNDSPQQMVQRVTGNTFTRIKNEQAVLTNRPAHMQQIVKQELMPYVDHTYSALYVLGSHAAKTEKSVLTDYIEIFKDYLVNSYAIALKSYRDQEVIVLPVNSSDDKNTVSVKALIKEMGKPDIQVIFKVRRDKTGQWRAWDMVVEGVSLLQSKRAEFADILRKEGVPKLMQLLEEKVQKSEGQAIKTSVSAWRDD